MKTRNFWIFGVLLALFASVSYAQQFGAKSDTISYPLGDSLTNGRNTLQDFGPLKIGQNECHTIYLKNTSTDPLIIQTISKPNNGNDADYNMKTIPSLPTILLQNEIISIVDLCFAPTAQTIDSGVMQSLFITGTVGTKNVNIYANFSGKEIVDSILQKPCFTATIDADLFGPIIMDGDISHTVTIVSNRYDSLWITPDSLNSLKPPFSYSGITSPYHLAPREIKTFTITYSPRSNVPTVQYRTVGTFNITAFNYCNYYTLSLPGVAIPPTADSISTALAAGSTDVLAMIGDNSVNTKTFHFTNTGTTNLKITAVTLKNAKSFAITNIMPSNTLPFILTPGQAMSVTVAMTTTTNGVYYDEVTITAENAFISMDFQLQGLRKNGIVASVSGSSSEEHVSIYPNPSHGEITVALPGIHNAEIEVFDILGRVVAKETASEKWTWNSNKVAGTFMLHVRGVNAAGESFQTYDRFIIQ
jgi:hypothetical protein